MYDIEMHEPSTEFLRCWQSAGYYLDSCAGDTVIGWLKSVPTPPFLEHLSFRIGNQLFFIRVEEDTGQLDVPGNLHGLISIAQECGGHACLMPMKRLGNGWVPAEKSWGLIGALNGQPIDPASLVTDEKIKMTDWEVHDFAVQVVRDHVENKLGYQLMSSHSSPHVDPSMWFVGDRGPEWVVVRVVRYPELEASIPSNVQAIKMQCARLSHVGHFASVSVASGEDSFESTVPSSALPLWRGHGMSVRFSGLESLNIQ